MIIESCIYSDAMPTGTKRLDARFAFFTKTDMPKITFRTGEDGQLPFPGATPPEDINITRWKELAQIVNDAKDEARKTNTYAALMWPVAGIVVRCA